ncbi:FtsQ-type POTRA domain-containing protein [Aeromicrobium phragmitis]|uniref:FtsQ-type POTRA domain-containing protein n=1 Tax=Aeromicrobium phragmitis TaxID=2478914 RepID=A0A3L8PKM8_9ACTN|nr:FtsQ-type POTRA domain-containing protein [Aeromicrobium phragmitis]RLV55917.1 FtsQ-type POTRA domain-containing protein [Aeromicrobium phragmitis]
MSDAFAAKLKQRRRRRWIRVLLAVLVLALIGTGVWAVWFSGLLVAQKVRVTGLEHLTEEQVLQAADVPLGAPLARLDTEAVQQRVRELVPVRRADVSRSWPETVVITVTERSPAAWISRDNRPWEVDAEGVIFLPVDSPEAGLPELRVDAEDADTVAAAARVAHDLRDTDPALAAQVAAIGAETQDSVELALLDGRTVVWGSATDPGAKIRVLKVLLDVPAGVYDVSVPTRPTTRD